MADDTYERPLPQLVWRSLGGVGRRYSWAQHMFPSLPAEDGYELRFDHAAEDVSPGNHSQQFSSSHDRNANNVMSGHLGDHGFDCLVFLNTDRGSPHDLPGFYCLQVFAVLH